MIGVKKIVCFSLILLMIMPVLIIESNIDLGTKAKPKIEQETFPYEYQEDFEGDNFYEDRYQLFNETGGYYNTSYTFNQSQGTFDLTKEEKSVSSVGLWDNISLTPIESFSYALQCEDFIDTKNSVCSTGAIPYEIDSYTDAFIGQQDALGLFSTNFDSIANLNDSWTVWQLAFNMTPYEIMYNLTDLTIADIELNLPIHAFTDSGTLNVSYVDEPVSYTTYNSYNPTQQEDYYSASSSNSFKFNLTDYNVTTLVNTSNSYNSGYNTTYTNYSISYTDATNLNSLITSYRTNQTDQLVLRLAIEPDALADYSFATVDISDVALDLTFEFTVGDGWGAVVNETSSWNDGRTKFSAMNPFPNQAAGYYYKQSYDEQFYRGHTTPFEISWGFTFDRGTSWANKWPDTVSGTDPIALYHGVGWDNAPYCLATQNYTVFDTYDQSALYNIPGCERSISLSGSDWTISGGHQEYAWIQYRNNSNSGNLPEFRIRTAIGGPSITTSSWYDINQSLTTWDVKIKIVYFGNLTYKTYLVDNGLYSSGLVVSGSTNLQYYINSPISRLVHATTIADTVVSGITDSDTDFGLNNLSWGSGFSSTLYNGLTTEQIITLTSGQTRDAVTFDPDNLASSVYLGSNQISTMKIDLNPVDKFTVSTKLLLNELTDAYDWNAQYLWFHKTIGVSKWIWPQIEHYYDLGVKFNGLGQLYFEWVPIQGTALSYPTGYNLTEGQSYELIFVIDRSRSLFELQVRLQDSLVYEKNYESFITDITSQKARYFQTEYTEQNYFGNATTTSNLGWSLEYKVSTTAFPTGNSNIGIDNIYSSSGLLDEAFYCHLGETTSDDCSTDQTGLFIEQSPLSTVTDQTDSSESDSIEYKKVIRDFRAVTGLVSIQNDQFLNGSLYENVVELNVRPISTDGEISDSNRIFFQMYVAEWTGNNHRLKARARDANDIDIDFGLNEWDGSAGVNGLDPPFGFDVGFGFYVNPDNKSQLILDIRAFDADTDKVQTFTVIADTPEPILDVEWEIRYSLTAGDVVGVDTDFQTAYTIEGYREIKGSTVPYFKPDILDPAFNWQPAPKTGFFDGIWNSITSFSIGGALSGLGDFIFGGLDSLWSALTGGFNDLIGWVQDIIDLIGDFFRDPIGFITGFLIAGLGVLMTTWDAIVKFLLIDTLNMNDVYTFLSGLVHTDLTGSVSNAVSVLTWFTSEMFFWLFIGLVLFIFTIPVINSMDGTGKINIFTATDKIMTNSTNSIQTPTIAGFKFGLFLIIIVYVMYKILVAQGTLPDLLVGLPI
jgi:hypothetical protein